MLLTFKTHIKLNDSQQTIINSLSEEARILYNYFLDKKIKYYEENKKNLSYFDMQSLLKDYKSECLTYDIKKEILRVLDNNYKSFFSLIKNNKDLNPQKPKFRGKDYFFTLSFTQDFIIKNNQLIISYLNQGRVKINLDYLFPIQNLTCLRNKTKESDIKQLKIYKKEDKYYASIIYEKKELIGDSNNVISIDLGKKNLVTLYNDNTKEGVIYSSKHLDKNSKYYDKRIDELKSLRDTKIKGSKRHRKLNTKIKYLYNRRKTQTNLILHGLSKDLVSLNSDIVIGELTNLKQNIVKENNKKLNRVMQNNWNLITFVNLLEYKQKLIGNKLTKVNEAWTSKTCNKCNSINHGLSLNNRTYKCEHCGEEIDRDLNGAINIMKIYKGDYSTPLETHSVSERFSWCNTKKMNIKYHKV